MLRQRDFLLATVCLATFLIEPASAKTKQSSNSEKIVFINESRGLDFAQGVSDIEWESLRKELTNLTNGQTTGQSEKEKRNALVVLKQLPIMLQVSNIQKRLAGKPELSAREALSIFAPMQRVCSNLQKTPSPMLDEIETLSVCIYTMNGYQPLAIALSSQDEHKVTPLRGMIQALDRALAKLPPYSGVVIHRQSMSETQLEKMITGYRFSVPTYLSSSKASAENTFSGNLEFVISSERGRDISGLAANSEEAEVLFPRGSRFEVVSRLDKPDKTVKVYLKEISGRTSSK